MQKQPETGVTVSKTGGGIVRGREMSVRQPARVVVTRQANCLLDIQRRRYDRRQAVGNIRQKLTGSQPD